MANVRVIPATAPVLSAQERNLAVKRRVTFYARVSTDSSEQKTSYEAQLDYYTKFIKGHPDWEFVGGYTDEGITATNTTKREGFKQMVSDGLAGKFDLLVTKSVSRFARNTVDSLIAVRKLKEVGCEIWFEEQNIYTLDSKGELLITIMSSLAQEESRSISENVTWGQRKRFSDGKVSMPYKRFLGYDKGEDGIPAINEDEAGTVRLIYRLFLEGGTPHSIAMRLTASDVPTPGGGARWHSGTVKSILSNEKYKGDALLQKRFTVDFLTKKTKANEGEVPQYYVENSHPAIVEPETFDFVQSEIRRRKESPKRHSGAGPFAGRIVCGECGAHFGAKKWHSTDEYSRIVYQCNDKFKGDRRCSTPHLSEENIKSLFATAANELLSDKETLLVDLAEVKAALFDTAGLAAEREALRAEMDVSSGLVQRCIEENARTALDQEEYRRRYDALAERFDTAKARLAKADVAIADKEARGKQVGAFIAALRAQDGPVSAFDERLWHSLVESVTVYAKDDVRFTFRDGSVIKV